MRYTLTLKEKKHEYGEVNTYTFSSSAPITFRAGQYCHIRILDMSFFRRPVREMSFASSPTDEDIMFTIDGSSNSLWQQKIKSLKTGDQVKIFGIHGNMAFPKEITRPVICIAGGVGVTPFRSLFRNVLNEKSRRKITFIHVATGGYLYESEFSTYPITQYRVGRNGVDATLSKVVSENSSGSYLVSGASSFVKAIAGKITKLGIPSRDIQSDEFEGLKFEY
jgi:ferredoxin-NADP reductase